LDDSSAVIPWATAIWNGSSLDAGVLQAECQDVLSIFEEQLASKEFDGQFEYTPYEEYDEKGSCVYSNFMSGNWAFHEAVRISIPCVLLTKGQV